MILTLLLLPLFGACFSPFLASRILDNRLGWFLAIIPLFMLAITLSNAIYVVQGDVAVFSVPWFPDQGIALSFKIGGLGQLFCLMISGIGFPIVIYSKPYFQDHPYLGRYYFLLFLFIFSMTGAVCANDLITLFVFWELTSVCSFLLIGLNHKYRSGRRAAIDALLVTFFGGLCLLTSFILLRLITGTWQMDVIMLHSEAVLQHPYFFWLMILFLTGVFTKSAQFPFCFWLPGAMKAPTPVSAYLHSATMVQLGIYLLARFHPLFATSNLWFVCLISIGGITMLIGVLGALKHLDMKLMLAYTTIAALGSLVFTLASNEARVIKATVAFLLVHALYKATLFMAVGDIQHQTGTRYLKNLSGLHREMPVTFLAVCVAGASMAGLPPLLGFYVKELVYEAQLTDSNISYLLIFIVILTNMMMATIAFIFIAKPFFGKKQLGTVKEANRNMSFNALIVAVVTLLLSMFPQTLDEYILSPAAEVVLGHKEHAELQPAHLLAPSLIVSIVTLAGAFILYLIRNRFRRFLISLKFLEWLVFHRVLDLMLNCCLFIGKLWTDFCQSGYLNRYITIVFFTLSLLFLTSIPSLTAELTDSIWNVNSLLLIGLMVAGGSLLFVKKFLTGLIALGAFGLGLAFFFIVQGAPDLTMTQALVETLLVILVLFSLSGLKKWPDIYRESNWHRCSRGAVAILSGCLIAVTLDAVLLKPFNQEVGDYFIANSLPLGHGRNVVNVILVDFRALDTLGEATILLAATLGIHSLLRKQQKRKKP